MTTDYPISFSPQPRTWRRVFSRSLVASGQLNGDLKIEDGAASESLSAARDYQRCCDRLGYEPLPAAEMDELSAAFDDLVRRYGARFKTQYGWAAEVLHVERPTFADIERSVHVDHFRAHYRMASHNVHANPKGVFFKLGLLSEVVKSFLLDRATLALLTQGTVPRFLSYRYRQPWARSHRRFIAICQEFGESTTMAFRDRPEATQHHLMDVLARLHARACQVAEEVVCLLDAGLADGAMARWRTLHEIAVVALFLSEHGDALAEQYVNHQVVASILSLQHF